MKILGIDYGKSKIGVAVGDTETKLVEPMEVLSITNKQSLLLRNYELRITNCVRENDIQKIVIGLPEGKMDEEIMEFGSKLARNLNLPVEYTDETLSTQDAQRTMIDSGSGPKKRKEKEDSIAAAIMLQSYFERG